MLSEVSVIIVNWNGREFLTECLDGLRKQNFRDFETILVDNGSTDGSVGWVREEFPEVRVMALEENRGFAGGNIAGIASASGKYIALLNNDTLPDSMWLSSLVRATKEHKDVGICASRLMIRDTDLIDAAGDVYTTAGVGLKRGNGHPPNGFMHKEYVFGACGGAVLYRRSMIDQIGFFDHDFFIVNEDTDLSFRAQLMGWKCIYVPDAVVYHKVSTSRKRDSSLLVYYKIRNADFVLIKNMPGTLIVRYFHHILMGQLLFFIKFALIQRQWKSVFRAKKDVLLSIPKLFQKRRFVQQKKVVSNSYLKSIFQNIFEKQFFLETINPSKKKKDKL